jgi:tRNA/rRNA methyltransferase
MYGAGGRWNRQQAPDRPLADGEAFMSGSEKMAASMDRRSARTRTALIEAFNHLFLSHQKNIRVSDIVLEKAQLFDTVQEAIADCSTVYASTVRKRELVMPVLTPEAMAAGIAGSPERSGILFGPERSGLETEDVALAEAIVTVPINPRFGSLNLAQAVILLAYEWSKFSKLAQPPIKALEPPAPHGEVEGMIEQLDAALMEKFYFNPPERTQATRNTLRTIFTKTGWSSREVKAVRGIIRTLASKPRRP